MGRNAIGLDEYRVSIKVGDGFLEAEECLLERDLHRHVQVIAVPLEEVATMLLYTAMESVSQGRRESMEA
jgi:hypothetical protein